MGRPRFRDVELSFSEAAGASGNLVLDRNLAVVLRRSSLERNESVESLAAARFATFAANGPLGEFLGGPLRWLEVGWLGT
jgi:hypothetical protein